MTRGGEVALLLILHIPSYFIQIQACLCNYIILVIILILFSCLYYYLSQNKLLSIIAWTRVTVRWVIESIDYILFTIYTELYYTIRMLHTVCINIRNNL